jgi:transposase InsO family protein
VAGSGSQCSCAGQGYEAVCAAAGRRMRSAHRRALQQAAPDLVGKNFAAKEPDWLWVANVTYIRSREDFVYLAFILDAYSQRIMGWSMATHLSTELVVDTLQLAITRCKPSPGLCNTPTEECSTPLCPAVSTSKTKG